MFVEITFQTLKFNVLLVVQAICLGYPKRIMDIINWCTALLDQGDIHAWIIERGGWVWLAIHYYQWIS